MTDQHHDELRRDSPAYTSDKEWENLPAPLGAVVSVRLDLNSARRLADIAKAMHRTQSRVVRDWVMERLTDRTMPVETRIAEAASPYVSDPYMDTHEELRARYRPATVRMLLVGESAPAGGTFFYRADSNLFHATREAFAKAFGPMPLGAAFLEEFRDRGAWLVDLAPRPANRTRGRPRQAAVEAGLGPLADILIAAQPQLVVAIKSTLENTVRAAADRAGIQPDAVHVLPFPLYQWRAEYVRSLTQLLTIDGSNKHRARLPRDATGDRTLHEAMVQVLREAGGSLPAREIANRINAHGLYRRQDGGPLGYQQVLARARKYPQLFERTPGGVRLIQSMAEW